MQEIDHTANPFPGLRPFESSETHLFFGRDGQSEELLRRLRRTRFLAVVGTSGSGKSSLVRAGLLPALQGGLMASAGSDWRIAILRPGGDPIGNLARALASPAVLGSHDAKGDDMQAVMAETTLRRSSLGLVELVSRARTKVDEGGHAVFPDYENLLIVVDQFEELFRFKQLIEEENSKEDAAAFVKLLLEAVRQESEKKIYVVLTMRSDFLGDCSQFFELPEAINNGQYLIPRMTRDERREAISGPVSVGQGAISEPLVNQLLNDVGDNPDQLPILQHALMRTWGHWLTHRNGNPIDIPDYQAIGGMAEALSRHADEAYADLNDRQKVIAEKLFKGLTEKGTDNREIRRPMEVQEICELTGADEAAVIAVIEVFRREGRSFLMPPPTDALTGTPVHLNRESLIDISHESLIRNWERLKTWVDEESRSARIYRRLADTAVLHKEGGAGLWRDPDLGVALTWREQSNPNRVWAKRYHPEFPLAMSFLDKSVAARDAHLAGEEARRRKEIKRTRVTALVFVLASLVSLALGGYAITQSRKATSAQMEAFDLKLKANELTGLAEQKQNEAHTANAKAIELLGQAETERGKARDQKKIADKNTELAQINAKKAAEERKRAEDARKQALIDQSRATAAEKTAEKEKEKFGLARGAALNFANEVAKQITNNRRLLYSSTIGIAQKAIEENDSERAQKLLNDIITFSSEDTNVKIPPELVEGTRFLVPSVNNDPTTVLGFEWYYLWKLANRKLATFKLGEGATPAQADATPASSPDAERPATRVALIFSNLISVGSDNTVKFWKGLAKEPAATIPSSLHNGPVRAVIAINFNTIATIDGTAIKIWSVGGLGDGLTIKLVKQYPHQLKDDHAHIALASSGSLLAIADETTAKLLNVNTGKLETLTEGGKGIQSVSLVKPGALITNDGGKFTRWNLATRQPSEITLRGEEGRMSVKSVAFTPDGRTMVISRGSQFQSYFEVWAAANADATQFALKATLPSHVQQWGTQRRDNLVVSISPDGRLLATGDGVDLKNGGGVKLWEIGKLLEKQDGKPAELLTLSPNVLDATSLTFSEDNSTLAVGASDAVQLWEVGEKKPFQPPAGQEGKIPAKITENDVRDGPMRVVSPDGKTQAFSLSVGGVEWADAGKPPPEILTVSTVATKAMVFSPDGKILAVGGGGEEAANGEVTLWDVPTRQRMNSKIDGHRGVKILVTSLAFSLDNSTLATGATDKTIELWDISESPAKLLITLEGHKSTITSVAFSDDYKTLASGDDSGTVNLWSVSSNQLLMTLKAASVSITAVAFSEGDEMLITKDKNGEIRLWPAAPREQVERLSQQTASLVPRLDLNNGGVGANESRYAFLWRSSPRVSNCIIGLN